MDNLKRALPRVALILYLVIGIYTYGHADAAYQRVYDKQCATLDQRINAPASTCYGMSTTVFKAVFWPFYWSAELQKG